MTNNTTQKFFDVSPPGKRPPSATSRPVITNRTPVQDPLLQERLPRPNVPAQVAQPTPIAATPASVSEPVPADGLDPQALLIQAGHYPPAKASRGTSLRVMTIVMCVFLVLMAAVSYLMVQSL